MSPWTNSSPDSGPGSGRKETEILLLQARNRGEMGGGMMTKPKGYCAEYIVRGSEDTYAISRGQWIASDTDLGARPKVSADSQISTMSVKGRVG